VLTTRAAADNHPSGAVNGLQVALDGKVSTSDQRLSDARTPTAHKSTHGTGGTDEIAPADIGARPAGNVDWSEIDNKPSIPAAQVNSDWTASSGVAQILHKPTIPSAPADIGAAEETHAHAAADVTSGIIAPARLGTGTADATTVLHGDGTWGAAGGNDWAVSVPPTSSFFQGTGKANATNVAPVAVGTMLLVPFKMLPFSYTAMVIRVAVGGGAGEIVRLGVYERLDDGSCGGLLVDAGTVTVNSGGMKTATMPPFTPSDPNVYLAFVPQGPTNTATFLVQNNNAPVLSTGLMFNNFENQGLFAVTGVTGALPADPTATVVGGWGVPIIGLY